MQKRLKMAAFGWLSYSIKFFNFKSVHVQNHFLVDVTLIAILAFSDCIWKTGL